MKKQSLLAGCIFTGFGLYFLLDQFKLSLYTNFYTWPTLLLIVGVGFLLQAYGGKEWDAIVPGVVLSGLSIHFLVADKLDIWPDESGIFLLVLGLGFLLRYVKTGTGLLPGLLFFAASALLLFMDKWSVWLTERGQDPALFMKIWPLIFIAGGIYFIAIRKK